MNVLLLKITLMPCIIAFITLVARRWGNQIGGLVGSMPWVAGPITLFFIMEQGKPFGIQSVPGVMVGILALISFCFSYSYFAQHHRPAPTLLRAYGVYATAVVLFMYILKPGLVVSYGLVLTSVWLALRNFPKPGPPSANPRRLPYEIPIRMLVATLFVLLITGLAHVLGPTWSGILTPFPILTTILAVFGHAFGGSGAAINTLRGLVMGIFGFSTFLFLQAFLLPQFSVAVLFGLALVVNVVINLVAVRVW
ncbi:MAG: hypothetical protein EAZ91_06060 [Cytophagales bacterium]|nr:MAG: hypothetical protein EAZ91_06060 [Cytophagales bacterium]